MDFQFRNSVALIALLCLAACGGGGGGGGNSGTSGGGAPTAPRADAGPDQSVNDNAATSLNGSGSSDSNGRITSYAWTQTAGTAVALNDPNLANPSFTPPSVCIATPLEFQLTVTDNEGLSTSDRVTIMVNPALTALTMTSLELAQTHVLPAAGKTWTQNDRGQSIATETLHLTGGRQALALLRLSNPAATETRIEGQRNGTSLGTLTLNPPSTLPATESSGAAYGTDLYSATIPASWMQPGLQLRGLACHHTPTAWNTSTIVGGDFPMTLRVLPFYLYGADEGNTGGRTLAVTGAPNSATRNEIFAKWPAASLDASNHPAGKVVWQTLVIPPRGGFAAYVASNTDDYNDGFDGMGAQLSILSGLMAANGESPQPVQYYSPLMSLNRSGAYRGTGGGLGGGSVGNGDEAYSGIFIHEQGHAFGIPHVGDAYDDLKYPYEWGSLNGSAWGYDLNFNQFLAPFVPSSASRFSGCASDTFGGHARARDGLNRCVKQDPMQSGSGDQASGYRFATFSDYSTAIMQRWFEGRTTESGGTRSRNSKIVRDASFPGGYKRWDTIDRQWVNETNATTQGGIFGLNKGLPLQFNVPVYAIVVTVSNAGTTGATQIYPPIRFTGNLMDTIDPNTQAGRDRIQPDTSPLFWYCRNGGCDYTLRIRYANLTTRHVLLQGGFRPFNQPTGTPPASSTTATDGNSFRRFVVNVPDDGDISRIELLSTPMVWNGMPTAPTVLASR